MYQCKNVSLSDERKINDDCDRVDVTDGQKRALILYVKCQELKVEQQASRFTERET